jgi:hypothetical protein
MYITPLITTMKIKIKITNKEKYWKTGYSECINTNTRTATYYLKNIVYIVSKANIVELILLSECISEFDIEILDAYQWIVFNLIGLNGLHHSPCE